MPARRSRLFAVAALTVVLIAFPLAALADHQFGDVPNTNTFHNDIDAIADAGVTTGCGGGNYCPSAFVTREQMAAFMNRLGALGPGKTPVVDAAQLDGLDSSQFVRSDVAVTRYASCPGSAAVPAQSTVAYDTGSGQIYAAAGTATFRCHLSLPHGASITGASFGVYDTSGSEEISECGLIAARLVDNSASTTFDTTPGSGVGATPGVIQLTPTSISPHVVDNQAHGYVGYCFMAGNGIDTTWLGVSVEYTLAGAP